MATTFEGKYMGTGMKFGVVIGRFNDAIGKELLAGMENALVRCGVDPADIDIAWVPGAYEIPLIAKKMATTGNYDAVITLGAVIRGATTHYDFVAGQSASGVMAAQMETGVPIIFGVLTVESIEQAWERAGTKAGNNGAKAGMTAIEMVDLLRQLDA